MSEDLLYKHFQRVARTPVMTREQEQELIPIAQKFFSFEKGECPPDILRVYQHCIEANIRLVISIAKGEWDRIRDFDDLVQQGTFGLVEALRQFDVKKGFKFSTYATWWIRQAVRRYAKDTARTVRLPLHMHDRAYRIKQAGRAIAARGGQVTHRAIAKEMGATEEWVTNSLAHLRTQKSIDARKTADEDVTLADVLPSHGEQPMDYVLAEERREVLMKELNRFSEQDREIALRCYGFIGEAYYRRDVGSEMGLTISTVRARKSSVLRRLRPCFAMRYPELGDIA